VTSPPTASPAAPPLLLAGHGSADPAGAAAFNALTARLAKQLAADGIDVAGGFIELSDPPLSAAVDDLAARGHRHLVAVPLMLASAGHAKGDIPAALDRERARHPGLAFGYGRPLGPHPVLLRLLAERIAAANRTEDRRYGAGPAAVLLTGRGSTDPDANAETFKTARLLWETLPASLAARRFAFTETAFVSLARPDVAEGLERCRLLGARSIVVARYFLFPGVLPDRVAEHAAGYAAAHPDLGIRCTDVLGECDEVAALVTERYHEALMGDIRMNCDTCIYRMPVPGFEHRTGAPPRPHHHPADPVHSDAHGHAH
jgi:sirohydrochlorin cobaltochelatase